MSKESDKRKTRDGSVEAADKSTNGLVGMTAFQCWVTRSVSWHDCLQSSVGLLVALVGMTATSVFGWVTRSIYYKISYYIYIYIITGVS